ncbi:LuxR C-terminal-related transcriptional regulator [Corallococcus exercitus]|uniref:LuxR C-terminal-related transcriptional regulator n=1 Tax=Corallococcus exercitus TaxID=2316736 RepID=UPI001FD063CD|nr:LuxR C-terminal-related transcriptional regulator [Corallococcus exercitus]
MEQGTPFDLGREAIEALERSQPDVVRLARVTSLAVRIDRAFLREARLELLPGVPPDAEADLWFSPLVESRSAVGLVLAPEVCHLLRQALARDEALLRRAWTLRQRFHPFLTPEMRLEEEVAWLSLMEPGEEKLNEVLMRSVRAMARGGERAMGVARWALRAIPRLPEQARRTEAALTLAFGTSDRLDFHPMLFQGTEDVPLSPALLQSVRASQAASAACRVGVRLHENALELVEPAPDGAYHVMELPDTRPRLLEISWGVPVPGRKLLVVESLNVWVPLPAGVRDLTLRSVAGEFRLTAGERGDEPRGETIRGRGARVQAPDPIAATEDENSWLDWRMPSILEKTVELSEEPELLNLLMAGESVIVVEAPEGYGKSTLVRRVHASLQRSSRLWTEMATLRLQGLLIGTQGFLNNLFTEFPYGDFDTKGQALRDETLAIINRDGAKALEQHLEEKILPRFRDRMLVVLVEGLDSITQERASGFVELLMGWARRKDPLWSRFHLIITATPGAKRLAGARYVPFSGLDAVKIRKSARMRNLELEADQAEYLWRLTDGCAGRVDLALDALKRSEGSAYQLVWDEALRKKTNYIDWLNRFPEVLSALGSIRVRAENAPAGLPRLLDVGILSDTGAGYEVPAKIYERLALYARDKVQPPGFMVDLYINAAPGSLPDYVDDFLAQLRRRVEADLGRELRVWAGREGDGRHAQLLYSWVLVNILTPAFLQSKPCMERMRSFNGLEGARKVHQSLDVLVDPSIGEIVDGVREEDVKLWELIKRAPDRNSPAYREALSVVVVEAVGQLVSLMLHASEVMVSIQDEPDENLPAEQGGDRQIAAADPRLLEELYGRPDSGFLVVELPSHEVLRSRSVAALLESWFTPAELHSSGIPHVLLERLEALTRMDADARLDASRWVSIHGDSYRVVRFIELPEREGRLWALVLDDVPLSIPLPMTMRQALTAQQVVIAGLLLRNWSNKQIADELALSEETVKASVRGIFDRLGIDSRADFLYQSARFNKEGDKQIVATDAGVLEELYGRPDSGFLVVEPPSREVLRSRSVTALLESWFTPAELHSSGVPHVLLERLEALTRMDADARLDASRWISIHGDSYRVVRFIELPGREGRLWALVLDEIPLSIPLPMTMRRALTARQVVIAGLLLRNWSNKQIADELSLSEETVKTHVRDIFERLEVDSRADLLYQSAHLNKPI